MKFIELTAKSGKRVLINADLITTIEPIDKNDGCIIYFASPDDVMKVSNPFEDMKRRIFG